MCRLLGDRPAAWGAVHALVVLKDHSSTDDCGNDTASQRQVSVRCRLVTVLACSFRGVGGRRRVPDDEVCVIALLDVSLPVVQTGETSWL